MSVMICGASSHDILTFHDALRSSLGITAACDRTEKVKIPKSAGESAGPRTLLVAHDCGYPLSRYTCRATRVAADFLDFTAFCRCSTGVALHPLKILVSHLSPPCAGRCCAEIWLSEKVSRYTGVSQLQLRVQLREHSNIPWVAIVSNSKICLSHVGC